MLSRRRPIAPPSSRSSTIICGELEPGPASSSRTSTASAGSSRSSAGVLVHRHRLDRVGVHRADRGVRQHGDRRRSAASLPRGSVRAAASASAGVGHARVADGDRQTARERRRHLGQRRAAAAARSRSSRARAASAIHSRHACSTAACVLAVEVERAAVELGRSAAARSRSRSRSRACPCHRAGPRRCRRARPGSRAAARRRPSRPRTRVRGPTSGRTCARAARCRRPSGSRRLRHPGDEPTSGASPCGAAASMHLLPDDAGADPRAAADIVDLPARRAAAVCTRHDIAVESAKAPCPVRCTATRRSCSAAKRTVSAISCGVGGRDHRARPHRRRRRSTGSRARSPAHRAAPAARQRIAQRRERLVVGTRSSRGAAGADGAHGGSSSLRSRCRERASITALGALLGGAVPESPSLLSARQGSVRGGYAAPPARSPASRRWRSAAAARRQLGAVPSSSRREAAAQGSGRRHPACERDRASRRCARASAGRPCSACRRASPRATGPIIPTWPMFAMRSACGESSSISRSACYVELEVGDDVRDQRLVRERRPDNGPLVPPASARRSRRPPARSPRAAAIAAAHATGSRSRPSTCIFGEPPLSQASASSGALTDVPRRRARSGGASPLRPAYCSLGAVRTRLASARAGPPSSASARGSSGGAAGRCRRSRAATCS